MQNIKQKPKSFWSYANSRLKTRTLIPTLIKSDGRKAETSLDKAEALNDQFRSVFTSENINNIPTWKNFFHGEKLVTIAITTEMVENKILKLNDNKPPGPDEIHPYFLKKLANCLSNPITFIINKSLNSGTNPAQWQKALITAIFKKGKRNNPENNRPISLTSVLSKIMESLVKDAILQHMLHNNLFTIAQHGFLPMRNCLRLIEIMSGRLNIEKNRFFEMQLNSNTRGHSLKIFKQHARTFVQRQSFAPRIISDWIMLPSHVVEATNVDAFKNALDKHWLQFKFDYI